MNDERQSMDEQYLQMYYISLVAVRMQYMMENVIVCLRANQTRIVT